MVRIRIGNDIPIRWAVTRCGVPEDFAGKSLKLYMRTAYSETEVTDFAVNGNIISWTYPGASQKATGTYTFTLVENEGLDDMATVDACDALKLVACTCSAECAESVEVTSDIDVPANGRTPVFETGKTETLDPGSDATAEVTPSGKDNDGNPVYRLNFGVPEGQPGKTPVFSEGQTVTGEPGTQASAKVTEDGADEQGNPKYKINLTIPRGDTGKTPVFVQQVNVTTLAPGSQATASIAQDGVDPSGNPKYVLSVGIPRGDKGETGDTGVQGPTGATGATFTPSVDDAGNLSWSNDGGLVNPETKNIRGPQGAQGNTGQKGDKGDTGAVYTPSVSEAGVLSWTNDGSLENPEPVNIKGPKGDKGDTGDKGDPGQTPDLTPVNTALEVLAHSDCTLEEKVTTLAKLIADICEGEVIIPKLNVKELGVWGDNNLIVTGAGAPVLPPDRAGQIYIDTTNNAQYNSTGNSSVSDWKIQN